MLLACPFRAVFRGQSVTRLHAILAGAATLIWAFALSSGPHDIQIDCLDTRSGQCWIVHGPGGSSALIVCASQQAGDRGGEQVAAQALRRMGMNSLDLFLTMGRSRAAGEWGRALQTEASIRTAVAPPGTPTPGISWRPVRPGGEMALPDGLILRTFGDARGYSMVLVQGPGASIALVDHLSAATTAALQDEKPGALVLSRSASHSPAEALGSYAPEVAVVHTGRARNDRADFSLIKLLEARCRKVYQTGFNGGITIRSDNSRYRIYVTRSD